FPGQIFLIFVIGYGAIRFCIEAMLGDPGRVGFGPTMSERALVVGGLLVLAGAYAAGPAPSVPSVRAPRASMGVGCVPAAVAWLIIPASERFAEIQLTSGQWFALAMSGLAAWGYRVLLQRRLTEVDESAKQKPMKKKRRRKQPA